MRALSWFLPSEILRNLPRSSSADPPLFLCRRQGSHRATPAAATRFVTYVYWSASREDEGHAQIVGAVVEIGTARRRSIGGRIRLGVGLDRGRLHRRDYGLGFRRHQALQETSQRRRRLSGSSTGRSQEVTAKLGDLAVVRIARP